MRYKLTVLLIVLNLALFSLIFYIDRVQSTRSIYESSSRLILDRSFVQGLDKVRITSRATNTEWQMQRSGETGWDVIAPVHWKANPYALQQLLFQLKALSWESRFPISDLASAGQSLESYNLADPPLQLELFNGTSSVTLSLGAPTEIGNRLYTLAPDGKYILVISKGIMELLQRDMEAFLDRRIFGIGMEESRVIQIQDRSASNVRVRLERSETGWNFVSPIEAEADGERVQAMISDWQSISAEGFAMPETTALEMDSNAVQLTFEGLNERETLLLAPAPEATAETLYYMAKRVDYDAVFQVSAAKVEKLRGAQDFLREKRILHRHADDWTSLEIQFGNLSTTLQQLENGTWQVLNTDASGALNAQQADSDTLENVKSLIRDMEAVRFVSDAPSENDLIRFGLNDPQRIIILRKASGQEVIFTIGDLSREDEETLLYGKTNQSASVFVVRPHILADIPLDPSFYRDRTIFKLPETAELIDLEITSLKNGQSLALDSATEAALIAYMQEVRLERHLNQPFADPFVVGDNSVEWTHLVTLTIDYAASGDDTSDTVQFYLSDRLGGTTQYIGYADVDVIGTLPTDVIESLDSILAEFPEDPGPAPEDPVFEEGSTIEEVSVTEADPQP